MILNYPCEEKYISLDYGFDSINEPQYSEFYKVFDGKHPGVDFDIPVGTEVFNSFKGIVVRLENHKGMGNTVGIRNGNILALYAHLSKINVKLGQIVKDGELIGLSGNTGEATTGPHLHFELRNLKYKNLKDMVFKPEFEKEIPDYSPIFTYKVNNQNTSKSFYKLALIFFGNSDYEYKIKDLNKIKFKFNEELPQGLDILIPNY